MWKKSRGELIRRVSVAAAAFLTFLLPPLRKSGSRRRLESECSAELVQGGVDVMKSSVDGVVAKRLPADAGVGSQGGNRAKQPDAEFDDEHAESDTLRC